MIASPGAARPPTRGRGSVLAPPWREIHVEDAERIEGWEHAQRIYPGLRDAYVEMGYRVVELPKVPVGERLAFVKDTIAHA